MIYGIGVDLVEIDRMERAIARSGPRLVERLYTADERAYCSGKRLACACFAARFACKEAFLKALGTGLRKHMRWRDIEVHRRTPSANPSCACTVTCENAATTPASGTSTCRCPTAPATRSPR